MQRRRRWPPAMCWAPSTALRCGTIPGRSYSLHDREHLFELNEAILRQDPYWLAQAGGLEDQGGNMF